MAKQAAEICNFQNEESIGRVASVDTAEVIVTVSDGEALRKLQVNQLVALRSARPGHHPIGLISRIQRRGTIVEPSESRGGIEAPAELVLDDQLRATMVGTLVYAEGTQRNVFRRSLEAVPEVDARCFVLRGDRLTALMRALSDQSGEHGAGLQVGTYALDSDAPAILDGNRFFQRHAVVVGGTGSGKSWTVARLTEAMAALPSPSSILLDIHGEYGSLAGDRVNHLKIAGPKEVAAGEGLEDGVIHMPYWLLTYEEMMALLLDRTDQNAPNQAMVLKREVLAAKERFLEIHDKTDVLASFTIDSPVPYSIDEVLDECNRLDTERLPGARANTDKAGPYYGKLTRFVQRLEARVEDRRMGFMFGLSAREQEYTWLAELAGQLVGTDTAGAPTITVVDLSEVPSDILPLVTGLIARLVLSLQQWTDDDARHPLALICDEAHLYIPERTEDSVGQIGGASFERIAKEGRKYGLALVVVTQRPSDVSRTVLSQAGNFIAMRLTNSQDQAVVRRLLPDGMGDFSGVLPVLDVGEAIVVGDASVLPSRVRVDRPTNPPTSSTIDIWTEWSRTEMHADAEAAVEALRRQAPVDDDPAQEV